LFFYSAKNTHTRCCVFVRSIPACCVCENKLIFFHVENVVKQLYNFFYRHTTTLVTSMCVSVCCVSVIPHFKKKGINETFPSQGESLFFCDMLKCHPGPCRKILLSALHIFLLAIVSWSFVLFLFCATEYTHTHSSSSFPSVEQEIDITHLTVIENRLCLLYGRFGLCSLKWLRLWWGLALKLRGPRVLFYYRHWHLKGFFFSFPCINTPFLFSSFAACPLKKSPWNSTEMFFNKTWHFALGRFLLGFIQPTFRCCLLLLEAFHTMHQWRAVILDF